MSRTMVAVIAGALALVLVGAGVFMLVTRQPQRAPSALQLSTSPSPAATAATSGGLAGTWVVDAGSEVGYRVKERFAGQAADSEAVARTSTVTGQLVLTAQGSGLNMDAAQFSADLSKLHSTDANATHGNAVRDTFVGRIYLETAVYPMAIFVAKPQSLPATAEAPLTLAGTFTLHGVARDVSIPVRAAQNGTRLEVAGTFQVHLADYRIDVPQVPFTTAAPDGTVEVHLYLKRPG